MLSDKKTNRQIITDLQGLLSQINQRLQAFETVENIITDQETKELLQDLIVYDIKTVMDDDGAIFPFH